MATAEKYSCCSCCFRLKAIVVLVFVGSAMITLGLILRSVIDQIFRDKIDENLVLGPDSHTYKPWHKSTVPIYSKYYFFDILNPKEMKLGMKPLVKEKGPYTYKAYTKKINITWDSEKTTVTYDEITWFEIDRDLSCSSCDPFVDEITTVNVPVVVVAEIMKNYPDFLHWKLAVSVILEKYSEGLFTTRKIHELLWGYEDPLLVELATLRENLPFLKSIIPKVKTIVLLQPNNTLQGRTTIYTGAKNIRNLEKWRSWKGKDNVDMWLSKYANMLNGTDGRQFAPRISKKDTVYFMTIQLCRSIYVTYDDKMQYQGIDVYRFTIPQKLFLNGSANPDNAAFYPQGFLPTGLLDPRKCQSVGHVSAPIFLSGPHFYLGDQKLVDSVIGVKPSKAKHELFFDIEPNLGVPLQNAIRLQINAFIEPVKDITATNGIRRVYMPVMWFDESASVDSDTINLFYRDILLPLELCHYAEISIICVGGLFLFTVFTFICCIMQKKKRLMTYRSAETTPLLVN